MLRSLSLTLTICAVAACGDNLSLTPDSAPSPTHDAAGHADSPVSPGHDAFVFEDAPAATDGIAVALGTADGSGLALPITGVTVTYLKPGIGNLTDDPAGFTIQAQQAGPGMFVSVDPSTIVLSPALAVGDVLDFTITTMGTVGMERRAQAISTLTRSATATDISPLVRDISAATDVVTNIGAYDSTVVTVTGTIGANFASSGTGFQSAEINTTGITSTSLTLRAPTTLVSAIDMASTCTVTASKIPVGRFNATVELGAYAIGDVQLSNCPAPVVVSTVASSATAATITFSRNIDPATVMVDGSQFTSDGGLTITAAAVTGHTVTLVTSAQVAGTTYTITVANTVKDLLGSPVGTPNTGMLAGYAVPAGVRVNEVNANVTGGCDLIELRVTSDGSMGNFVVYERTGVVASSELHFQFPAVFNVTKNSLVMIHLNSASTTCNPNGATQEVNSPTDQPVATYAKNYDTAYDFWATDTGLTATDNVITVYDQTGTNIVDAVFLTTTNTGATDTLTQANAVAAAGQWLPAPTGGTYTAATYSAAAVLGLGSTGTTVTGTATSIQRNTDADTNLAADWVTAPQTFGTINSGQATLPAKQPTTKPAKRHR